MRPCCQSGASLVLVEQRSDLTVSRCDAPQPDGTICGRHHYRATLQGMTTQTQPVALGGSGHADPE